MTVEQRSRGAEGHVWVMGVNRELGEGSEWVMNVINMFSVFKYLLVNNVMIHQRSVSLYFFSNSFMSPRLQERNL